MSDRRQQELTSLLDTIVDHSAVRATDPDPRLRRVHYDSEVRRILKAFVDAQWLADFDARLDAYRRHIDTPTEEANDA